MLSLATSSLPSICLILFRIIILLYTVLSVSAAAVTREFTTRPDFDAVKGPTTLETFDSLAVETRWGAYPPSAVAGEIDFGGAVMTRVHVGPYHVIDPTDPVNDPGGVVLNTGSLSTSPRGLSGIFGYAIPGEISLDGVVDGSQDLFVFDPPVHSFGLSLGHLGHERVQFRYTTQSGATLQSPFYQGDHWPQPDPDLILGSSGNSRLFWGVVSDDPIVALEVFVEVLGAPPFPDQPGLVYDDVEFGTQAPVGMTIESRFTSDDEMWSPIGGILDYEAAGGNPDGHITWEDNDSGIGSLVAPAAFSGDLSSFTGGRLSVDIIHLVDNGDSEFFDSVGEVTISGPGGSMTLDIVLTVPAMSWSTHSVAFDPVTWGVPDATWLAIVSDVTSVTMKSDLQDTFGDVVGIDNFQLGPEPECDDLWDNDLDTAVDYPADPSCTAASQNVEGPACDDGIDNDGDGDTDFPDDDTCLASDQRFESFEDFSRVLEVAQESGAGVGDFDSNVLGYIGAVETQMDIAAFYSYGAPVDDSYNGSGAEAGKRASYLFGVENPLTAETSLVLVHGRPQDGDTGSALVDLEVVGTESAVVAVLDDPDQSDTASVTPGTGLTQISLQHSWSECCTDGAAISQLGRDWEAFVAVTAIPMKLVRWRAYSASQNSLELDLTPDRRVRIRPVPEPSRGWLLGFGFGAVAALRRRTRGSEAGAGALE